MPESPFQRAQNEGLNQPEGSSARRKSRSHPTSKNRNKKRKLRDQYVAIREEAQLHGIIPTTPEGAVKPEQVPASAQQEQPLPHLISQAIRKGWNISDEMKPHLVQELIDLVMGGDTETKHKIAAFNALRMADKDQYERDHPEEAGKAKGGGGGGNISVTANVQAAVLLREMIDRGEIGSAGTLPASDITSTSSSGGHGREGAEPTPPESHNGSAGEGMEDTEQQNGDSGSIPTW